MIFASDLDRTLIYSKKFIENICREEIVLVERMDEKEISYMTKKAFDHLSKLKDKLLFVPVTTRTIKQYKRIFMLNEVISPKYAVVSNGGNILIDGKVDEEWRSIIQSKLKECAPIDEIRNEFDKVKGHWVLRGYDADNLFLYNIVDEENVHKETLDIFNKWLDKMNWNMSLQGRKLYFVPNCINKWSPIEYIKNMEKKNTVFASGDSLLDMPILNMANYSIAPTHGEIYKTYDKIDTIEFTDESGILCAEEIIKKVELKIGEF
ncbi:MAG: hypothetical protein N4A57_01020 [Anaeromicrobium sp.]|jgi:hydroxymethylpyrimidine pyrophosphatase-like HAD family hydrolase|uniref:HAD family hydrolase n=1 Tax=Anaeromicrobium sp. TaxID=1929132 RepID=UPI0025FC693A|nr:HAD family hydrolase [Anaeromicrobium sp.]MCT4592846.1 hypothetical protein [Anaeromicrobium sp.]